MFISPLYLVITRRGGGGKLCDKENELMFFRAYYLMKNGLDALNI